LYHKSTTEYQLYQPTEDNIKKEEKTCILLIAPHAVIYQWVSTFQQFPQEKQIPLYYLCKSKKLINSK